MSATTCVCGHMVGDHARRMVPLNPEYRISAAPCFLCECEDFRSFEERLDALSRAALTPCPGTFTNVEAHSPASTPARHVGVKSPGTATAPDDSVPSALSRGAVAPNLRPARQTRPSGS